jgi:hypothetical protein
LEDKSRLRDVPSIAQDAPPLALAQA